MRNYRVDNLLEAAAQFELRVATSHSKSFRSLWNLICIGTLDVISE
jgi:hypothetical protein